MKEPALSLWLTVDCKPLWRSRNAALIVDSTKGGDTCEAADQVQGTHFVGGGCEY